MTLIPEAEDAYSQLTNVTHIDISNGGVLLEKIPRSWSSMRKLEFLNLSGNPKLSSLPFDLCNKETTVATGKFSLQF